VKRIEQEDLLQPYQKLSRDKCGPQVRRARRAIRKKKKNPHSHHQGKAHPNTDKTIQLTIVSS
jgi:hypothetical protein